MRYVSMAGVVVIVVDDEADLRTLLTNILEDEGYTVVSISGPQQALQQATELQPALFLMDLMMPEMSGIELARRLRGGAFPKTPMVALSASPSMLRLARESGHFHTTLQKPFELTELLEVVQQHAS